MWTLDFWRETAERAIKSAAQAPLVVWVVGDRALNAFTLDWRLGLGVAAGGALVSVLTSLASARVAPAGSPSLVSSTVTGDGPAPRRRGRDGSI